ncbi:MAG: exopolysaccharide biosynthesis protein [Kiritimatiellaceae bacterium]|nr:exopolysaccharide biosynthesis protein [Kiritimatiellaceae bacterium]
MTDSLGEKLQVIIGNLPSGGVTLAEIRDLVGQDGLLLLTAFLTLIFMVPVSIPGVSTVFGAAILLIGVCRLLGRNLWIPKRIAQRVLPSDKLRAGLNQGSVWVHRLERISRPHRLKWLTSAGVTDTINNCSLIAGAVLLMAPFGLIPFSNTLPALALLFFAIGLLQRDGLCILLGHLSNIVTVIYFVILVVGGSAAIRELFRHIIGKAS